MAQAMASMAGLCGSSQAVLEGSLQLSGSTRLSGIRNSRVGVVRSGLTVRAQQMSSKNEAVAQSSRRAILGLVASASFVQVMLADAKPIKLSSPPPPPPPPSGGLPSGSFVQVVLADATPIKLGPPPPPSGGLPGTLNSDEARDLDLPLKNRFFIQPLPPSEAAVRAKESAKEILNVKEFIDKKAWPYVQNDLRLKASYLRYDLNNIIAAKSKEEKKPLKELTGKLFATIDGLDHAAKIKSTPEAEKYYAETVSALKDVLAKIG